MKKVLTINICERFCLKNGILCQFFCIKKTIKILNFKNVGAILTPSLAILTSLNKIFKLLLCHVIGDKKGRRCLKKLHQITGVCYVIVKV